MSETSPSFYEAELERTYHELPFRQEQFVQLRQSKVFMEKHYRSKLVIDDLADKAAMSRFHFIRVFKSMYGISPMTYLRDLRVTKAKHLLQKGFSVTDVCLNVGYESLPSFSSAFKKCAGYTPREYRSNQHSNLE
ncbi:AraC family transcriptional regulator [uncultured Pseudoteredinibacter sp.]|uniref:helix-turn-helix domain-containing protein n=1 Tax=uncultured Pseudoteredinibacter sp. TaxID=1641701 RepID=UPI002611F230|nr:AraC family transcriptional regulator [uncultured Pseudoteredinibacter sp.]